MVVWKVGKVVSGRGSKNTAEWERGSGEGARDVAT